MSYETGDAIVPVLVLCGPMGGGKRTLINMLHKDYEHCVAFPIRHTTRAPKSGEVVQKAFHFVSKSKFQEMIENEEILEYTEIEKEFYGLSKSSILDIQKEGKICILDLDPESVKKMQASQIQARFVFVQPADMDTLKKNLISTGTKTEELQEKLDYAKELEAFTKEFFFYPVIVNKNDADSYKTLKGVLKADIEQFERQME